MTMISDSSVGAHGLWWTFTLNNPREADITFIKGFPNRVDNLCVNYMVFQLEVGEQGTEHIQGCLQFITKQRLTGVKKLLPRAHWEPVRNIDACIKYCKKEETRKPGCEPYEVGEYVKKGKRKDWEDLKEDLEDPTITYGELVSKHFGLAMRFHGFIKDEVQRRSRPRTWKSVVIVLTGEPGWGKTKFAHEFCRLGGIPLYTFAPGNGKNVWLPNYTGEAFLIDDFRGKIVWEIFLSMLDRYECRLETKGGFINFNPPIIFITSNYLYQEWYDSRKYPLPALSRRIDYLIKVGRGTNLGIGDGPWSEVACNTDGNFGPRSPIPYKVFGDSDVLVDHMMDIVDVPTYDKVPRMETLVSTNADGEGEVKKENFSPVAFPPSPSP